jgi:hypothetical protein
MKKKILKYFLIALILFLWVPSCFAVNPWSGYWWPLSKGELIYGYNSDVPPLQKYDAVAYGYYPGPATYESYNNELNYSSGAGSWFGLCNGWSAAAIMTKEPTSSNTVQGITFSVGDQKGLLSEAWYETSGDGWFEGYRYDGNAGDDLQDLYPDQLWILLQTYVRDQGVPIVLDITADEAVWNYPFYNYDLSGTAVGNNWYDCSLYIEGADDGVYPDFVGIQKITRNYTFMVQVVNGNIVNGSGYWTGDSVQNHPDFAWYPGSQPALRNSSLNYSTIQTICKGGGTTTNPVPKIWANGYSDAIYVNRGDPFSITIGLEPGSLEGQTADWWVVMSGHSNYDWISFVYGEGWYGNIYPMLQYPLLRFSGYEVFNNRDYDLTWGTYYFYFAVDNNADGRVDATWYDYVEVNVVQY